MPSRQLLFKTFYRLGFVPWDGHPLAHSMQNLIEGEPALPAGRALDIGCLHGMSPEDRDAYVREVTAVSAPDARLLLVAFVPGGSWGVPGIDPDEVQRRFAAGRTLLSSGSEPAMDHNGKDPARHYLFQRAS
jgi:hypothetical protein